MLSRKQHAAAEENCTRGSVTDQKAASSGPAQNPLLQTSRSSIAENADPAPTAETPPRPKRAGSLPIEDETQAKHVLKQSKNSQQKTPPASKSPLTTGGSTSGKSMTVSTRNFPGKFRLAISQPVSTAIGRLTATATQATEA